MIEIVNKEDCCGCSACVSICSHNAIHFKVDEEGFLYPKVDKEQCVNCGLCEKVCPIKERKLKPESCSIITVKAYYALRHKDKNILLNSSSGGAFSLIADYVIENGGVVCGVEFSSDGVVRHGFAESKNDLKKFRGSKYVQSELLGVFSKIKEYLIRGRLVLFSGTPCQVDGLKKYLIKDYPKLITVDLVCHSIPSPLIYNDYIKYISKILKNKIVGIDMRYKKSHGWSHKYSYRFLFENGKSVVDPLWIVNWGNLFFSELINRPSCAECKYTNLNRPGDFTIADFWDDNHKRPDIYSKKGTSLLLVNTDKGLKLFNKFKDYANYWSLSKEDALQPCLIHPTVQHPQRKEFWNFYQHYGFVKTYKKYFAESKIKIIKKLIKIALTKCHIKEYEI